MPHLTPFKTLTYDRTMPQTKKPLKKGKSTKNFRKGSAGTGVLYLCIIGGAVVMGFMLAGSGLPERRIDSSDQAVVTLVPKVTTEAHPNMQLETFEGVTGAPSPTPTTKPSPEIPPSTNP
jgi:hypothetical protein